MAVNDFLTAKVTVRNVDSFRYRARQLRARFGKYPTQMFLTNEEWTDLRSDPMFAISAYVMCASKMPTGAVMVLDSIAIRIRQA